MHDMNPTSSQTEAAPESLEQKVAKWSETESDIRATVASTDGITVAGHTEGPKKGREAVHKALMVLVNMRTCIEIRRKELKSPILALGNLVDSEAKRLTAISATREAELKADRDAYDAEQARIAAEIEAERKRQEAEAAAERQRILTVKIQRIANLGGVPDVAAIAAATESEFEEMVSTAIAAKEEREAKEAEELLQRQIETAKREEAERVRLAEEARIRREREIAELAADAARAEAAALVRRRSKALQAVGGAIDADWLSTASEEDFQAHLDEATDAKILRDREAQDLAREKEELAKEKYRVQMELNRIEDEKRAEQDRRDQEARDLAEAERAAKAAKEARERAEELAAQAEAERPEREQVLIWIDKMELEVLLLAPITKSGIAPIFEQARRAIASTLLNLKEAIS